MPSLDWFDDDAQKRATEIYESFRAQAPGNKPSEQINISDDDEMK